jgi:hypothetical protein
MNTNPFFKKLTNQQLQIMLSFIAQHELMFDSDARHVFSLSRFVMGQLLIGMNPSNTNNKNRLIEMYRYFLMRCSRKFGRLISSQFMLRGRSRPINTNHILRSQSAVSGSLLQQFLSIPHYGLAVSLGNTSAIAEMVYRLSKIYMYDRSGNADNRFKRQLLRLIEYGISRGCQDCLAIMAHFLDIGFGGIVQMDGERAIKLAGESAEAGSVIGWKVLANLLKSNASNQDPFYDEIYVDETYAGVRLYVGRYKKEEDQHEDDTSVSKFRQRIISRMILEEKVGKQILSFSALS